MGIIKRGVLGGFSGKIGNIVGTSWKGLAVMKSLPLSVANPRSTGQVSQRTKFTSMSQLASALLGVLIIPYWNRFASQMSGYNLFVMQNIANAFTSVGDFVGLLLKTSPSTIGVTPIVSGEANASTSRVTVDWIDSLSISGSLESDQAYVTIIDSDGVLLSSGMTSSTRQNAEALITLDGAITQNQHIFVYLFFVSADGKRIFSDDVKELIVGI